MVRDILERAVERAGSEAKLGRAIGFTQNAVWRAKRVGRVSAEMAAAIHRWSDGEFSKSELRPDLWPLETAPSAALASASP